MSVLIETFGDLIDLGRMTEGIIFSKAVILEVLDSPEREVDIVRGDFSDTHGELVIRFPVFGESYMILIERHGSSARLSFGRGSEDDMSDVDMSLVGHRADTNYSTSHVLKVFATVVQVMKVIAKFGVTSITFSADMATDQIPGSSGETALSAKNRRSRFYDLLARNARNSLGPGWETKKHEGVTADDYVVSFTGAQTKKFTLED